MEHTHELLTSEISWLVVVAAAIAGLLCGALSPYLVWKRLGLLSDSVSHASLMVIAVALAFDLSESLLLIPFSICIGLMLSYLQKKNYKELDSAIAIFFAGFMGIGLIIMHITGNGSEEVLHALFGDIQDITEVNLVLLCVLTVLVLGYLAKYKSELRLTLVQPDLARVEGISVDKHTTALLVLCSVTVAICLQIMGIVLVTMLLVAPSMISVAYAKSSKSHSMLSLIVGVLMALFGVLLAKTFHFPVSATIATLGLVLFFISVFTKRRTSS